MPDDDHLAEAARVEARHRALFAALREPIVTTTVAGWITGFNAAAAALFGKPASLYGRGVSDLLPFVPSPAERHGTATSWQGRWAEGSSRSLDLEVTLTELGEGTDQALVYVVHDVSHHAEVSRLREQLLYSMAHELRGPLTVLDNALEILSTDYAELTAEEFANLLQQARRTAGRLRTLTEDLLSAGSIQSGTFAVTPRPTELLRIVDDALEIVAPSTEARAQKVEVCLGSEPIWVLADHGYARQVLSNLLANASKYSPSHSLIRITAEHSGGTVRVAVEDQGPGIAPEHQPALFDRFYRVRMGNEEPGVGLGLAIAKGIVEAHGGSIGIESAVGSGTRVWFTLPATERRHASSPG
jgi:signal transduction histidine kinase